ncbi:unnamed protein product, partial [Mesorhabditis belari]|uniref:Pre-mRNA-splicing factor RBM22 n=1 Tax=Mesorhabditis belari TaxID=2138241 RepID=A0AAF3FI08_9BILA
MSMSKSSYNYNRKGWEDAEFPILCETCLGPNPYLRMQKDTYGKECTICERPFTNFRWQPGKGARFKTTEVCQTCSKIKNICQTCLFDLEFGLPVQVRDHALKISDDLPRQGANRDFFVQNQERALAATDGTTPGGALATVGADHPGSEMLRRLARTGPYYKRNAPHICSFFVKGECKRGEECPYRHEKPSDPDDPLSQQNMRDRYYGAKDPVAEKILNRATALPSLQPPEDATITTLYVGNLGPAGTITEKDLNDYFYQYGDIRHLSLLPQKGCAFVNYTTRESAEMAAERSFNRAHIKNRKVTIRWGVPHAQRQAQSEYRVNPVPNLPTALPIPDELVPTKRGRMEFAPRDFMPPPAGPSGGILKVPRLAPPMGGYDQPGTSSSGYEGSSIYYPSQDPERLGAKGDVID